MSSCLRDVWKQSILVIKNHNASIIMTTMQQVRLASRLCKVCESEVLNRKLILRETKQKMFHYTSH